MFSLTIRTKEVIADIKSSIACPQNFPLLFKAQKREMSGAKTRPSYLNLVRNIALNDHGLAYQNLRKQNIDTLLIYGDEGLDPYREQIAKFQRTFAGSTLLKTVTIDNSGHVLFIEKPKATYRVIKDYID